MTDLEDTPKYGPWTTLASSSPLNTAQARLVFPPCPERTQEPATSSTGTAATAACGNWEQTRRSARRVSTRSAVAAPSPASDSDDADHRGCNATSGNMQQDERVHVSLRSKPTTRHSASRTPMRVPSMHGGAGQSEHGQDDPYSGKPGRTSRQGPSRIVLQKYIDDVVQHSCPQIHERQHVRNQWIHGCYVHRNHRGSVEADCLQAICECGFGAEDAGFYLGMSAI